MSLPVGSNHHQAQPNGVNSKKFCHRWEAIFPQKLLKHLKRLEPEEIIYLLCLPISYVVDFYDLFHLTAQASTAIF